LDRWLEGLSKRLRAAERQLDAAEHAIWKVFERLEKPPLGRWKVPASVVAAYLRSPSRPVAADAPELPEPSLRGTPAS
jgi:hypothetical protein